MIRSALWVLICLAPALILVAAGGERPGNLAEPSPARARAALVDARPLDAAAATGSRPHLEAPAPADDHSMFIEAADALTFQELAFADWYASADADAIVAGIDADGDNMLSHAELAAATARLEQEMASAFLDLENAPGDAHPASDAGPRSRRRHEAGRFVAAHDTDDDAQVSFFELNAPMEIFSALDRDGDGFLSRADIEAGYGASQRAGRLTAD